MRFSRVVPICGLIAGLYAFAQTSAPRWHLDGKGGIAWDVAANDLHQDEMEMSGQRVSLVLRYGVQAGGASLLQFHLVYPWLRTLPNNTNASLDADLGGVSPRIFVDGAQQPERVKRFGIRGMLTIESAVGHGDGLDMKQTIFPSTTKPLVFDRYEFTNRTAKDVRVELEDARQEIRTDAARGLEGSYVVSSAVEPAKEQVIKPGETASFAWVFAARRAGDPVPQADSGVEETARRRMVDTIFNELRLETPEPMLDTAYAFAKVRAAESVFATKGGLFHSPGGSEYYAAAWANDEMEYSAPLFGMLGDAAADEAMMNEAQWFSRYMKDDYKPFPSSIVAEGAGAWGSAGDRGDAAMLASGMGRFALERGDKAIAERVWPWVQWCLEYDRRRLTADGVVGSDSDELEGRFPAGKANLSTSALAYDALRSAVMLGTALGKPVDEYRAQAEALRGAIERYFGAEVQGFRTYRYYDGATLLRAWATLPLAFGIYDRKDGTIAALMSDKLWGVDGLVVQQGDRVFWDRATAYALKGMLDAGATETAMDKLRYITARRLLGEHVPYIVEQGPDAVGKMHYFQRHLAGESALYARVFTEGLFGIRPTGLRSFTVDPRLPKGWDKMALREIHAFGSVFDVVVTRAGEEVRVEILEGGKVVQARNLKAGSGANFELGR